MLRNASASDGGAMGWTKLAAESSIADVRGPSIIPATPLKDASRNVLREKADSPADIALTGDVRTTDLCEMVIGIPHL